MIIKMAMLLPDVKYDVFVW